MKKKSKIIKILSKLRFLSSKPLIFIYFVIFVLIWSYPLILNFNSKLFGYNDAWQFVWNFWWVKTALINLHTNPFYTNYLHWPNGISLLFHTLNLSNSLPAIPLQYFFSLTTTYNILLILNTAFNGFAAYLLLLYLSKNKFAAFVGGYLIAFSPYMFSHILGHLNLMSFSWLILFILYFLKMIKNDGTWFWPMVFLVITGLADWYYFFFLGIFVIIILVYYLIFKRKIFTKTLIKKLLLSLILGLLILSPYIISMIYLKVKTQEYNEILHNPSIYSVDLTALLIPNVTWLFFKKYFWIYLYKWHWNFEGVGYLGYSAIILLLYGLIKIRKKIIYLWGIIALLFFSLSLGPHPQINGIIYENINLPYYYFYKYVPFMTMQGVPGRYMSMVYLSLGIVAAISLSDILKLKNRFKYLIAGVLTALLVFEYLPAKLEITAIRNPDFYSAMAKDSDKYAVMDVSSKDYMVLYYQTIHHKYLISGYTSRPSASTQKFLSDTPVISNIYHIIYFEENINKNDAIDVLKKYSVKYIIVSPNDKKRQILISKISLPEIYQNRRMIVYQVY